MTVSSGPHSLLSASWLKFEKRYTFSVGLVGSVIVSVLVPLSAATGVSVANLNAGKEALLLITTPVL